MSRLRIALGAAALALGLCTACYTPSVPLPPPLVQNMQFTSAQAPGTVILTSPAEPQIGAARFSIFNVSQGTGVIFVANSDGSFTSPAFTGNEGDYVQISYDKGNDSAELCTTLHLAGSLTGATCN
ncbi:MAG TPA: hypothetical protein VHB97_26080 [Polyangia bacterium]|nr:hypothetical protein [Polyangia bacterium]